MPIISLDYGIMIVIVDDTPGDEFAYLMINFPNESGKSQGLLYTPTKYGFSLNPKSRIKPRYAKEIVSKLGGIEALLLTVILLKKSHKQVKNITGKFKCVYGRFFLPKSHLQNEKK